MCALLQDQHLLHQSSMHRPLCCCHLPSHRRDFVTVIGLIPALVVMLREAQLLQQAQQGQQEQHAGISSIDICSERPAATLHFVEQDSNAAAAAALLALSRNHSANKTAILQQLTLQLWMGHNVRLDGLCAQAEHLQLPQE